MGDVEKKYDDFNKDSKPFKAEDGKYYASMEEVKQVNERYFIEQRVLLNNIKEEIDILTNVKFNNNPNIDKDPVDKIRK